MKDVLINSHLMPSHMINFIKFVITLTLAGIVQHWHLSVASMCHGTAVNVVRVWCKLFYFVSISLPIFTNFSIWFGICFILFCLARSMLVLSSAAQVCAFLSLPTHTQIYYFCVILRMSNV